MRHALLRSCLSLLLVASTGCKSNPPPPGESPATGAPAAGASGSAAVASGPSAVAKAKEIYATRCTPCHGVGGAGDGAASASLVPKPRNFQDAAWHQSIDDAYIEKIIKYGGAAVGKSPTMPGNPDLNDPTVVAELRTVVRSFKR